MSREILFKAKRLDNGEWVEGDLLHTRDSERILIFSDNIYRCDRSTLCQWTGLYDKNGKRIWENDIVKRTDLHNASEPSVGFVSYNTENASFVICWMDKEVISPMYHWRDRLEVIGTLFDGVDSQYNRNVTYDVTFAGSEVEE